MKKGWWILIAVVVLLIAANLNFRIYYQLKFNRSVKTLSEDGYPISLDDLEKIYVLPEGAPNAADVYIEAFSYYHEPNDYEKQILPYHQGYTQSKSYKNISKEVINSMSSFLEKNHKTLGLLDEASRIESCLWPKKREQLWLANECLYEIKDITKLLQVRNLFFAETQDIERLLESLKTSIALGKTFQTQASLLDHLVCMAIKNTVQESLNEALSRLCFSDQALSYLQCEMAEIYRTDALYHALVVDRVSTIEFWKLPYKEQGKDSIYSIPPFLKFLNTASGLIKKDAILSLDYLEDYLSAAQLSLSQRPAAFLDVESKKDSLSSLHVHLKYGASMAAVNNIDLRVIGQLRCAETTLAVERYRIAHDSLPAALAGLVPEFMDAVPAEPFDGQPLRYIRHEEGGYTVYCIGDDCVDNGGLSREQMEEKTGESNPAEYDWPFTVKR